MTQKPQQDMHASRRGVLLGVGVAGLGALVGCSTASVPYDSNESGTEIVTGHGNIPVTPSASGSAAASAPASPAAAQKAKAKPRAKESKAATTAESQGHAKTTGTLLGDVSEIPVGEGKIFPAQKVVVTQPSPGKYRAFSAICTHVGCTLDKVEGGKIYCPCHGAVFTVSNGVPVAGPTSVPLPHAKITVTPNGEITLL